MPTNRIGLNKNSKAICSVRFLSQNSQKKITKKPEAEDDLANLIEKISTLHVAESP
jgi:hypothetical protein